MHVRTFNISLMFALRRLFVGNKNRPHLGVQAMLLLGCSFLVAITAQDVKSRGEIMCM